MAPVLCRQVVPVAGLAAAELPYWCPPAMLRVPGHLPVHQPGHSVLPSLHPHPRAALNPSLVLPHLWGTPMPRFCHLSEGIALHPPQVWPLFMPVSELNKLHSAQGPTVQEDLGTSSHPRLQSSGVRGGGRESPTSLAAPGSCRSFSPAQRS